MEADLEFKLLFWNIRTSRKLFYLFLVCTWWGPHAFWILSHLITDTIKSEAVRHWDVFDHSYSSTNIYWGDIICHTHTQTHMERERERDKEKWKIISYTLRIEVAIQRAWWSTITWEAKLDVIFIFIFSYFLSLF